MKRIYVPLSKELTIADVNGARRWNNNDETFLSFEFNLFIDEYGHN